MESVQGSLEEIFPRRERLFDQLFRGATRQRDAGTGRFVWRFAGQKLDGEGWHYRVKGSRGVVMESWPVSSSSCFVPERDPPLPPAFLFSRVALKRDIGRMDPARFRLFISYVEENSRGRGIICSCWIVRNVRKIYIYTFSIIHTPSKATLYQEKGEAAMEMVPFTFPGAIPSLSTYRSFHPSSR